MFVSEISRKLYPVWRHTGQGWDIREPKVLQGETEARKGRDRVWYRFRRFYAKDTLIISFIHPHRRSIILFAYSNYCGAPVCFSKMILGFGVGYSRVIEWVITKLYDFSHSADPFPPCYRAGWRCSVWKSHYLRRISTSVSDFEIIFLESASSVHTI